MRLKTEVVIVFKMVFFKENIRLVISLLFSLLHSKGQVPFTHIKLTLSLSPPNSRFLYIISFISLWFLGSSWIFGLSGGPLFSCELGHAFKQMFLTPQYFWTLLYREGFLGYLVYNIAKSLPHFIHLRSLLCVYSFLSLFLLPRSAPTNT